jgi:hypothetical protein
MIYTLGHKQGYLDAIASDGRIKKLGKCVLDGRPYPGGSVWQTLADAERVARLNPDFMVFGVEADWDADTEPENGASYHNLLHDAWIVTLEE